MAVCYKLDAILSLNQQHESTEGNSIHTNNKIFTIVTTSIKLIYIYGKTCKLQATYKRSYYNCKKVYKLQGNGRRRVLCLPIRDAFNLQAVDTIDWMVHCDWLQVASSCFILYTHNMLMRSAKLVQVLQDLLQALLQL